MERKVYFVRHGTTDQLDKRFYQANDEPLSARGHEQARVVAGHLAEVPVEVVVTSTLTRAVQTAEAIARETKSPLISSPLFQEIVRPSAVRGKAHADEGVERIMVRVRHQFEHGLERYADEESFDEFLARATMAWGYLEKLPAEHIAVVTHSVFLVMLMAVKMISPLTPRAFTNLRRFLVTSNTGITTCKQGHREPDVWNLLTWNDHGHLREAEN